MATRNVRVIGLLVLLMVSSLAAQARAAEPMTFEATTLGFGHCRPSCPQVITAQGEIEDGTAQELVRFVHDNIRQGNLHGIILLDSPGGHVLASMELGVVIRKLGMAVIVARPGPNSAQNGDLFSGRCYSACVYALMGGRKRVVPMQSRVGVHRMFNYTTSFDFWRGGFVKDRYYDDGEMRQKLARYSQMMGVARGVIDLAERTSPDYLRLLSPSEISRWRLGAHKL